MDQRTNGLKRHLRSDMTIAVQSRCSAHSLELLVVTTVWAGTAFPMACEPCLDASQLFLLRLKAGVLILPFQNGQGVLVNLFWRIFQTGEVAVE